MESITSCYHQKIINNNCMYMHIGIPREDINFILKFVRINKRVIVPCQSLSRCLDRSRSVKQILSVNDKQKTIKNR